MSLKKYLIAGSFSIVLILGACGGTDSSEEDGSEESAADSSNEENTYISYSGQYGDFSALSFGQHSFETPEGESEEETEEGEETGPTEVVVIEFGFTNNSDVATAPQEAFALDLAVRQMNGDSEVPLENLTMDLPEDYKKSEEGHCSN